MKYQLPLFTNYSLLIAPCLFKALFTKRTPAQPFQFPTKHATLAASALFQKAIHPALRCVATIT